MDLSIKAKDLTCKTLSSDRQSLNSNRQSLNSNRQFFKSDPQPLNGDQKYISDIEMVDPSELSSQPTTLVHPTAEWTDSASSNSSFSSPEPQISSRAVTSSLGTSNFFFESQTGPFLGAQVVGTSLGAKVMGPSLGANVGPSSGAQVSPSLGAHAIPSVGKKISKNKDVDEARKLGIDQVISVEDIVLKPLDEMNEILEKSALSEHQKEKAREIRRKGKNKNAAQNCRKRKAIDMSDKEELVKLNQETNIACREQIQENDAKLKAMDGEMSLWIQRITALFINDDHQTFKAEILKDELVLRPCSTLGISDLRVDQEIDELQHHHHQAYHRQLHGDLPPALANPSERPPPIRPTPVVGYPLCVRGVDLSDHASSRFAEQIPLANNNRELFHQQLPTVLHLNGGAMLSSITATNSLFRTAFHSGTYAFSREMETLDIKTAVATFQDYTAAGSF